MTMDAFLTFGTMAIYIPQKLVNKRHFNKRLEGTGESRANLLCPSLQVCLFAPAPQAKRYPTA
jgi:hypothetical protein